MTVRTGKGARPKKTGAGMSRPWTHLHCIGFLLFIAFLLSVFIGGTLYAFVLLDIPDIRSLESYRPHLTTRILDSQGQVVGRIFQENRLYVSQQQMPELLAKAFVAAEDARFYSHPGVDFWSILRALIHNLKAGGRSQGGSTITQQVTRSLLLTRKKLYSRKIKEAILAYRIDSLLSKNEILSIYLNEIYLGEGAYGVGAAAETYFGKQVGDLSLAETALLAGLPQAPSRYSPFENMELARKRQAYVLNRMAEEGYITPTAARRAYNAPLQLAPHENTADCGYFIQHVRSYLENKYGSRLVATGGLTVHTTLNRALQEAAAESIRKGSLAAGARRKQNRRRGSRDRDAPQGSLIAMELGTGRVLAMTGGTDFADSQFNRAVQARRQPGSAFKPIIYAAAFEQGFTPATVIDDAPLQLAGSTPGQIWKPRNFEGKFFGPTTLRTALIHSRNIVTIKLLQQVGIPAVIRLARKLGIHSPLTRNLTLALGAADVSLLEITAAYAALGNSGMYTEPVFITKITDSSGKVLEENKPHPRQVVTPRTAYQLTLMLEGVIEEGTGKEAKGLPVSAAGKTGTTDQFRDAWFIGYTPELAVGIWVGYDRKQTLGTGETGGQVAAPIFLDFMKTAVSYCGKASIFRVPD